METVTFCELKNAIKDNMKVFWLSANAGVGGFMSGMDASLFPGVLRYLRQQSKVFEDESWATTLSSSATGAAIFGAGVSWYVSDKFGRKKGIMAADCLFFIGSILVIWCKSPWLALACRILVGLGIGISSVSCSLYVSEFAPAKIRGSLVNLNGVMLSGGHFVAYIIIQMILKSAGLYWLLVAGCLPAALQFVIMLKFPESPRRLHWQKNTEDAARVTESFYSAIQASEFERIAAWVDDNEDDDSSGHPFRIASQSINSTAFKKALIVSVVVQFCCVLGAKSVSYHGELEEDVEPLLLTCFIDLLGSLTSFITVEKYGRRQVLLSSVFTLALLFHSLSYLNGLPPNMGAPEESHLLPSDQGCPGYSSISYKNCSACIALNCGFCAASGTQSGTCMVYDNSTLFECKGRGMQWFEKSCPTRFASWKIFLIELYRFVHSVGLATTPTLVSLEIFPVKTLAFGGGLSTMIGWTLSLPGGFLNLARSNNQEIEEIFLGYAFFCWALWLLIFIFLQETRGVPLEEIEATDL